MVFFLLLVHCEMWFHRWREWLLTFLLKIYIYKTRWCNIMKILFIFRRSWSNKKLCEMCCWLLNTTIHNCLGFFLNLDKSSYGIIGPLKTSKTGSSLPMHFTFRSMFFLCMYTLFEETYFRQLVLHINILWRENLHIWFSFLGILSAKENPF